MLTPLEAPRALFRAATILQDGRSMHSLISLTHLVLQYPKDTLQVQAPEIDLTSTPGEIRSAHKYACQQDLRPCDPREKHECAREKTEKESEAAHGT